MKFIFTTDSLDKFKSKLVPYYVETEPLFLNPDGVRKRFPIGWHGHGRYIPGSLQIIAKDGTVIDKGNIKEEDNGIFFEFATAPEKGSYTDYTVKYIPRPKDVEFSNGVTGSAYPGEEYFLFPNWINAKGCRDAFWVGKYQISRSNATASSQGSGGNPTSRRNVRVTTGVTYSSWDSWCNGKGIGFHRIRNREWMNIAYWQNAMNIPARGNVFGYYYTQGSKQVFDEDGFIPEAKVINGVSCPAYEDYGKTLAGYGPNTWRHNGQEDGIADLVGNVWEAVAGLVLDGNIIKVFDEDANLVSTGLSYTGQMSLATGTSFTYLRNDDPYYVEGIPTTNTAVGTAVPGNDGQWFNTSGYRILYRGGCCYDGELSGLFTFSVGDDSSSSGWCNGCRLARYLLS